MGPSFCTRIDNHMHAVYLRPMATVSTCIASASTSTKNYINCNYDAHQEAIDTARRNAYGSSGYLALGNLESSYDSVGAVEGVESSSSSLGGGSAFGSKNAASFGANSGAGFGASNQASFGSNSAFSSNSAFQTSHSANFNAASSHNVGSNVEFADANNAGTEQCTGTGGPHFALILAPRARCLQCTPTDCVHRARWLAAVRATCRARCRAEAAFGAVRSGGAAEHYYQRKVTTTSSTPQIVQQPSASYTYGSNTGSSFGSNAASTLAPMLPPLLARTLPPRSTRASEPTLAATSVNAQVLRPSGLRVKILVSTLAAVALSCIS
ncbi:uncharacterized protein LOC133837761 [Drosophila sulfurigaster albostrigata]|uniref:uncharacterized protein LOC133837761 n=1 Tax=Drosophila sulfurigaster albostrigata TaxID=89887 RepID=UPI002D21B413|nr:uncharacterized protein LOC133837761 [Drosophila sulfurigaster albostrigata]